MDQHDDIATSQTTADRESDSGVGRGGISLLYISTFLFISWEWLLFELLRLPYDPPRDMLTMLGTEKYFVMKILAASFVIGVLAIGMIWISLYPKLRSSLTYMMVTLGYLLLIAYFLVFPLWYVTPWQWIFK